MWRQRGALRKAGRIVAAARCCRVRKACQTIPYIVDLSRRTRMARAANTRRRHRPGWLQSIRTDVAAAHQSSVRALKGALFWCDEPRRVPAK